MNVEEMRAVIATCKVPDFEFKVHVLTHAGEWEGEDPLPETLITEVYLQGHYIDKDITTKEDEPQSTRKWKLSKFMTKSELVKTAFKCYLTSLEHRARETFLYRNRRVFGPHFDVDALHNICRDDCLDYRREIPSEKI